MTVGARGEVIVGERAGRRRRTRPRVALAVGVSLVALAGLSQVLLPILAVQRVRDELGRYGKVGSVSVSAWPAIELLWGKAQSASASASTLKISAAQAVKLAWEGRGVDTVKLTVSRLWLSVNGLPNGLILHDAVLTRQGSDMVSQSTLTRADLEAGLPAGIEVQPLDSHNGTLRVRASGALFGGRTSIEALVMPSQGKLVAVPQGLPLLGLLQITLFAEPHMYMEYVSAMPIPGHADSWRLTLRGRLV